MISKNLWIIVICLSIIGSVGVYSDLFLSLEAYNTNPEIFIEYESNQEAVDWFAYGEVPFWFLISIVIFPFSVLFFLYTYERHKNIKHAKVYFGIVIFFVYFIFWTRLTAGLTWYLPTWHIAKGLQSITFVLFAWLCFFIFYYFPKQTNSFPFNKSRWINETNS